MSVALLFTLVAIGQGLIKHHCVTSLYKRGASLSASANRDTFILGGGDSWRVTTAMVPDTGW